MLSFCPHCANMLLVDHCPEGGGLTLYCQTCPYEHAITETIRDPITIARTQAYFMQIQIRSADEPMSTFYQCCKCANQWREG